MCCCENRLIMLQFILLRVMFVFWSHCFCFLCSAPEIILNICMCLPCVPVCLDIWNVFSFIGVLSGLEVVFLYVFLSKGKHQTLIL